MPKATDAQAAQRVNEVYRLLLNGAERADIHAYAAKDDGKKKAWGIEARQIDTYIRRAKKLILEHAQADRTEQLSMARARLNMLFAKALGIQDYKTALSVQKEINTLEALHAAPAAQTLRLIGLDDQQLITLMRQLEKNGMKPSEVFNAMLVKLDGQKERADGR